MPKVKEVPEAPKRRGRPPKNPQAAPAPAKTVNLRSPNKKAEKEKAKPVKEKAVKEKTAKAEVVETTAMTPAYAKLQAVYQKAIDNTEKKFSLTSGDMGSQRVPTGCITLDYYLGGGLTAGMYSVSGQSQSAKSTLTLLFLGTLANLGVPILKYHDAEGSVSADRNYAIAAMRQSSGEYVFGKKLNGKYTVVPRIRYSRKNVIEPMFSAAKHDLDSIPDKVFDEERNTWFLRVPVKDKNMAGFHAALGEADKKLSDSKFKFYEDPNPYPQMGVFADSYPAFVPRKSDEEEEESEQSAQQAAAYSKQIKRVVGKLSEKYAIWWGVNQLRKKVRTVGREDPWYRPCGEAIYFYANVQMDMRPMSTPEKWQNSETKFKDKKFKKSFERSVEAEKRWDRYSYKHLHIAKSKLGNDGAKMIIRVHEKAFDGKGRGIDPVWDIYQFLEVIGLCSLKNKKGEKHLNFIASDSPLFKGLDVKTHKLAKASLSWEDFKKIVLASTYKTSALKSLAKEVFKKHDIKPFDITKWSYDMINSGFASALHEAAQNAADQKDDEIDLEDE